MAAVVVVVVQEELEREWSKTHTNGTIAEENGYSDDEGVTVYPDRQIYGDGASEDEAEPARFAHYDDVDRTAAVKIQSNFRGYRTRKHLSNSQY